MRHCPQCAQLRSRAEAADACTLALRSLLDAARREVAAQVESHLMASVEKMSKRIECLERRLRNARVLSESSEQLAAEAVVEQLAAKREAGCASERARRLARYIEATSRRRELMKLTAARERRESAIWSTQGRIRSLESDPEMGMPRGIGKRRSLTKAEAELRALRAEASAADAVETRLLEVDKAEDLIRDAALRGDAQTISRLVSGGYQCDAPDDDGSTALDYACDLGHADAVAACLEAGADPFGGSKSSPIVLAANGGHQSVVELLLNAVGEQLPSLLASTDARGRTALHAAAARSRLRLVQRLLRAGARVDALDKDGNSPLHLAIASQCDDTNLVISLVHLLFERSNDPDRPNVLGDTPGQLALRSGRAALIAAYKQALATHKAACSHQADSGESGDAPPPSNDRVRRWGYLALKAGPAPRREARTKSDPPNAVDLVL